MKCPSCRAEVRAGARFCDSCGAQLTAGPDEHRKVVTVVFCDVVGSTALGESTDAEVLRSLLSRYFAAMKGIVERHGGTVEKFVGDAVMAVFGVPLAHEDDALRACHAALEMRDAFPRLEVRGRIGINSGEVVAGTEERLAAGDALNVAARLQQAAAPNEALIGEATLELVRGRADVEPLEPLRAKGKAEPLRAFRLVSVLPVAQPGPESRFVGRGQELASIRLAWERARSEQRCELVTIVGEAGVGKSRLVAEALAGIEARSVHGRCLPYGEGITYWPVAEVVKQLGRLPADPGAAESIRSLLGESDQGTSADEISWAFRRLAEAAAPVVLVFDDIHWGEETFLDLVEQLALLSSGAALLVLCMARPELLDRKAEWPVALQLQPLPAADVHELIGEHVAAELRDRIAAAAGGNPLFVLEMLAMAEETHEVEVPPTLRALLAARLDQLDAAERHVLERGAVEGEIFHRGAVQALAPEEPHVLRRLAGLVGRGLIRPDTPQLPGEDAFRFRHLLVRDAAYDALPKATRAQLHERFADWLQDRGRNLVDLDEIAGYHLEQAARYRRELGGPDAGLAERAGERLAVAGRRALWRADNRAAAVLIERALELTRPSRLDIHLELDLSYALALMSPQRAIAIAEAAAERAHGAGDEAGEALAHVVAAYYGSLAGAGNTADEIERLARTALPLLEQADDHAGLVALWSAVAGGVANVRCHFEELTVAHEQAIHHARLAGQRRADLSPLFWWALPNGPRPADEALRTIEDALAERASPGIRIVQALLLAMLGRFDDAWRIGVEASGQLRERTGIPGEGELAAIAATAGDHESAARYNREFCEMLEEQGHRGFLSGFAPALARSLCALGRCDEAEPFARLGRELATPDDVQAQMIWRQAQALVESARGNHAEAEQLAREAVEIGGRTDALNWQGDAFCDLAEVLGASGRRAEAADALERALARYERKQNLAMGAQVRPRLAALRERAPALSR